jgi:CHAT domain-containing protein
VLIVGDPRNDLPQARKEAEEVALRWKQHSPAVLFGADALEATVRERLQQAEFFHYSGHGVFSGVDGVDSTLALAEGGALDLGEILTLSHVPSKVVLSACDSAGSETASDQGLTLAEAFVSAGADLVVAPTRRIKDTTARKFMARLYELLPSASSQAWAAAVQRAGLNLRESGEADDWVSFRLVRP